MSSTTKFVLDGERFDNTLGMKPVNDGSKTATFPLGKTAYDTFAAKVGIVDSVEDGKTEVVFAVEADGKELWASPPVTGAKQLHDVEVQLEEGVKELKLIVRCTGDASNALCAWGSAQVKQAPWLWEYRRLQNEGSELVKATEGVPTSLGNLSYRVLIQSQLFARQVKQPWRSPDRCCQLALFLSISSHAHARSCWLVGCCSGTALHAQQQATRARRDCFVLGGALLGASLARRV